jgi:hypothetical protein
MIGGLCPNVVGKLPGEDWRGFAESHGVAEIVTHRQRASRRRRGRCFFLVLASHYGEEKTEAHSGAKSLEVSGHAGIFATHKRRG